MTDHTTLHIDCHASEKAAWVLSARASKMAFSDWVRQQLNAAVIDTNPAWLEGLSERARICLLAAGFNSRESLLQAITEGLDISTLGNAGGRVKSEVEQWLKQA